MSYAISTVKTDLEGILKGTSTSKVRNLYGVFDRAAQAVLLDMDPQETRRVAQVAGAVYDSVYDYASPADLKGNAVIDVRPQFGRLSSEAFSQRYGKDFDRRKGLGSRRFQVAHRDGTKLLRIDDPSGNVVAINQCDSLTGNGTWAGSDDATNLTLDALYKVSGAGSINYDVSGAGTTATLANSTMSAVDLTDHDEKSTVFLWHWFPDASDITSVALKWGNDASNHWSRTVTAQFFGAFQDGWNLLGFAWDGATETGTVDPAAIDYLSMTVTYAGDADTDFRLDSVVSCLGRVLEVEYYSKYLFADSSGAWKERVTADTDTVNLDVESYQVFLSKAAELAMQQVEATKDDTAWFRNEYRSALRRYRGLYKSEKTKPTASYYRVR